MFIYEYNITYFFSDTHKHLFNFFELFFQCLFFNKKKTNIAVDFTTIPIVMKLFTAFFSFYFYFFSNKGA
jgi:hypothetical protein